MTKALAFGRHLRAAPRGRLVLPARATPALLAMSLVTALLAAATFSPLAHADGDPASDYLLATNVFLTSQSSTDSPAQRQLLQTVTAANRAGFGIRVATISDEYDLGSVTALWRKPRSYARFLGLELSGVYQQRLLVVMPNGFGFNWPGHPASQAYRELDDIRIGGGDSTLAAAAQTAIRRLSAAAGIKIPPQGETWTGGRARATAGGSVPVAIIVAAGGVLLIAAVALVARQRGRRARRKVRDTPARPPADGSPLIGHRAITAFAALLLVAAATPIALLLILRHAGASDAAVGSIVTPPPFRWPAGRRPAPGFVLRDQNGRAVSVNAYHGRPLIVTFVDPLCRNLCPLEAHLLNQVVRGMPPAQRPVILAVSVDVYADTRADLLQDEHRWDLVPQWHWAVGRPAQLAAVWKRYEISVAVTTKRIGSTFIHSITHTEGAYIIDATRHERALFLWPFYPQDVKRVLQQLS